MRDDEKVEEEDEGIGDADGNRREQWEQAAEEE